MKNTHFAKGVIPIAFSFVIAISITIAVLIGLFWHRVPLSANSLKRFQGINYAEAALYETFNRFRRSDDIYGQWDADAWAAGTTEPTSETDSAGNVVIAGGQPIVRFTTPSGDIDVKIEVVTDGATGRNKVSATVDYGNITLSPE